MKTTPVQKPVAARVAESKAAAKPVANSETVAQGWKPKVTTLVATNTIAAAAATDAVSRPPVEWGGGVQHNGNNPEVVDQLGRSYSSRAFAPQGVGFTDSSGNPKPQQVFSSNKNMTGKSVSQTLVLSNATGAEMKIQVNLAVSDPASSRGSKTQQLTIPPNGSIQIPVGIAVGDKGFTAFKADIVPLNEAAQKGNIHVDVAVHAPAQTDAKKLIGDPLMKTEGERGYRVPPSRLGEHAHYLEELRYVMSAAKVTPDPVKNQAAWPDAKVAQWAQDQKAKGARGEPTAFDPLVNRGIQGRVNGLVASNEGSVQAPLFSGGAVGSASTVRVIPNKNPPGFASLENGEARRAGTSPKDAGAYGKLITSTLPLHNPTSEPMTFEIEMRSPPPGQDGSQLPGHQIYNGPVTIEANGGVIGSKKTSAKIVQPAVGASDAEATRSAKLVKITIQPGKTVNVKVGLETHANSQFPLDLKVTRTQ
jgi:hypothetical protein